MVDGICGCSGGFWATSAACARGAIVLAMFLASDCLPGRPKINGRYQFEVKMQLKGRKSSQKRVRKCGYRASLNDGTPYAGCPLCPCQNWTPPPGRLPVIQPDLARPKTLCRWKQLFCSLSCLLQGLAPFGVIIRSLITSPAFWARLNTGNSSDFRCNFEENLISLCVAVSFFSNLFLIQT